MLGIEVGHNVMILCAVRDELSKIQIIDRTLRLVNIVVLSMGQAAAVDFIILWPKFRQFMATEPRQTLV